MLIVPVTVSAEDEETAIARGVMWARVDGYICSRAIRTQKIGSSTWRLLLEGEPAPC
jgi:hypothetical protein